MKSELLQLGLTDAESIIYEAMLQLGSCTVKDIAKHSGFHRTNIYDVLEKLKEKGLVSCYKEGRSMHYKISDPKNLYDFLNDKKRLLDDIFPEIMNLQKQSNELIEVEVFKGEEGMKTFWRDVLRENVPLYGFGIKGQFREKLPIYAKQWMRDAKKQNLKYYGIYTERNLPSHYTEIKFVSEELSSPVATFIYGDKVNINIWEPSLVAITITSKLVAQMYKNHFDLLWKIAKP
jgi:sugar-specific transcriptional regulator TrmB